MTKAKLQQYCADLRQQQRQAMAVVDQLQGAITMTEKLLAEWDTPEVEEPELEAVPPPVTTNGTGAEAA